MNPIVQSALTAEYATLVREQPVPTGKLGWGVDLSCVYDVDDTLSEVDPTSPRAIGQALLRRLLSPRGSVRDDLDYGLDLRGYLNRALTEAAINGVENDVVGECRKDERVQTIDAVGTRLDAKTLQIALTVTPHDPEAVTFKFVFAVSDGGVLIDTIDFTAAEAG